MFNPATIIGKTSVIYPRLYVAGVMIIMPIILAFIFTYSEEVDNYLTDVFNQKIQASFNLYFIPLMIIAFVMGNNMSQLIFSFTKMFHSKLDLAKTVIAYQYAMNLFYIALPLLIASLVYDQLTYGTIILEIEDLSKIEKLKFSLNGALGISIITPITVGFITSFFNDFQYYRALGFLKRSQSHSTDNLEKIDNLAYAVKFYNKYLDERIEYQIVNVEKIISKFAKTPFIDSFIEDLQRSFERDDKLSPLRQFASFVSSPVDENFLIKFHSQERIIKWAPVLIGIGTLALLFYNFIIKPYIL